MTKYISLGEVISSANVERCGNRKYPVLSMTMHNGIVLQNDRFKKSLASLDQSNYKVVKRGQLVVGFPIDEGVLYVQKAVSEGIMSPAYNVWNINRDIIDAEYLEMCLHSPQAMQFYKSHLRGTTARRRSIPTETLLSLKIYIPSLDVQKRIVSNIDKIDSLISKRRQQLASLDLLVKARFVEMFGDPVSNSHGLLETTLPEMGEFGRGVSKHRPRNDPKLLGGKYPLIQTGDVAAADLYITQYSSTYSDLGLAQSKIWNKGTLCITIAANIAKTAILDFDACFPDSVVGFMANEKTNNVYIHYWFSFFQRILESQAPESAQKNINLKILSELKVICPAKDEQDRFADFVTRVDKAKLAAQKSLQELEMLKKSLMQQYFG